MRYHFHIREAADVIADEEGAEFASLKAARAEARASLRDLVMEDLKNGRPSRAWCVDISTHDGTVLDCISLQLLEN